MNQLIVFSLAYQNAEVSVREKFSFDKMSIQAFNKLARSRGVMQEWMILSTCNRTEIIAWMQPKQVAACLEVLAQAKASSFEEVHRVFKVIREQENSLQYLGEVAVGLRSQILGDAHLINQLKKAYGLACGEGTLGPFLHRLIQLLFSANKRITNETGFKKHVSSVPQAAVEMVSEYLSIFSSPSVAVVGFGQMGEQLVRYLVSRGIRNLTVYNRSLSKAVDFFQSRGIPGSVRNLADLPEQLVGHDIVFSAIYSPQYVITSQMLQSGPKADFTMLVDLSLPRTIDPLVNEHVEVLCLSMDHIREVAEEAKQLKVSSVGDVRRILGEYIRDYSEWREDYRYLRILKQLKRYLFWTKGNTHLVRQEGISAEVEREVNTILKQFVFLVKQAADSEEKEFYLNSVYEIMSEGKIKK
ncbi:MAG: glutamyl-tRNA reductase [Lunatimonas sp.]|uniref:glutamyl-tRNA reductase n=1 Tax=Lunatimonas sp. TaxID=2060141 RepID=UPI00263B20CB|nr:glutamyl-tRNA reductase [Lunatimonas sp.]MCC5939377.1 glutamyl-tRNA reductase [Lunatimonas sp.]